MQDTRYTIELPSESQWEYVARDLTDGQLFPWGNDPVSCDRAMINDGSFGCGTTSTAPVCSRTYRSS